MHKDSINIFEQLFIFTHLCKGKQFCSGSFLARQIVKKDVVPKRSIAELAARED